VRVCKHMDSEGCLSLHTPSGFPVTLSNLGTANYDLGRPNPALHPDRFYMTHELRTVFTFLNGSEEKEEYLVTCENWMKWKFQSP